jgi:hypothetical protein
MIETAQPDLGTFASLNPDYSIATVHDDSRDSPVPLDTAQVNMMIRVTYSR